MVEKIKAPEMNQQIQKPPRLMKVRAAQAF
jgi:hypothetical protein